MHEEVTSPISAHSKRLKQRWNRKAINKQEEKFQLEDSARLEPAHFTVNNV
jgi:hypothetical protein